MFVNPGDMLIGHDRIINFLSRSLESGRVAHAYGFFGPEGIGKFMVARLFAYSLLCPNHPHIFNGKIAETVVEKDCPVCRSLTQGLHPDLRIIVPSDDKELGIDDMRAVSGFLGLSPFVGKCKVIIINDAHKMSNTAGDALLKTLEDTPAHSVLILVTSRPEQFAQTIRSRLLPVRFARLKPEEFVATLDAKISKKDSFKTNGLFAGRPGLVIKWEKEAGPYLSYVKELLGSDFRSRFDLVSQKNKPYDPPLPAFLELAMLVMRDALLTSLGSHNFVFFDKSSIKSKTSPKMARYHNQELIAAFKQTFRFLRFFSLFNLSTKLTRDAFLFTTPKIELTTDN